MTGKQIAWVWLAWGALVYVNDKWSGRPVSSWVQVAVICSAIWATAP